MPLDPISLGVIGGVLANALTPMLSQLTRATGIPHRAAKLVGLQSSVAKTVTAAVNRVALDDRLGHLEITPKQIEFLKCPDVNGLLSKVIALDFDSKEDDRRFETLEKEFVSLGWINGVWSKNGAKANSQLLFELLWKSCHEALVGAVEDGVLAAHDRLDAARHRVVLDCLASIHRSFDVLQRTKNETLKDFIEFEKRYRVNVAERHRMLAPPQYDRHERWPIKDLFVQRTFAPPSENNTVSYSELELLSSIDRFVVLGQPGGGKSTFLLKLCVDLASQDSIFAKDLRKRNRNLGTPILVVLHDYGARKEQHPISLVEFMAERCRSIYQLTPPEGVFEYLLTMSRAIVLFDGLDELLDTGYRQEIRSDVEAFCASYPTVPVVVTSRERGYEQAPLAEDRFAVFHLKPLSPQQIRQYAERLFRLEGGIPANELADCVSHFITEADPTKDLLENPLMLSLIINLYRGANYIPRNRPEVIQKCAEMLFAQWDLRRRLFPRGTFPSESLLYPAVAHVAYWVYSNPRHQSGMTKAKLVEVLMPYIISRITDDQTVARLEAEHFVDFCTGRAWVLTDTGATGSGEKLFEFTHRTFLEYFTAVYMVRMNPMPIQLMRLLRPRIAAEEWDVVCQLSLQMLTKQQDDAGNVIIIQLMNAFENAGPIERRNILSFTARSLQYLIVSPHARRQVAQLVIKTLIDEADSLFRGLKTGGMLSNYNNDRPTSAPAAALQSLLRADERNLGEILSCIGETIEDSIRDSTTLAHIAAALELICLLKLREMVPQGTFRVILEGAVYREKAQEIRYAAERYFEIAWIGIISGFLPVEDMISYHGSEKLGASFYFVTLPNDRALSILEMIYLRLFGGLPDGLVMDALVGIMEQLGVVFSAGHCPWFAIPPGLDFTSGRDDSGIRNDVTAISPEALSSNALFCGFVLVASWLEELNRRGRKLEILDDTHWLVARFSCALHARVRGGTGMAAEFAQSGFSAQQTEIALRWAASELNFTNAAE